MALFTAVELCPGSVLLHVTIFDVVHEVQYITLVPLTIQWVAKKALQSPRDEWRTRPVVLLVLYRMKPLSGLVQSIALDTRSCVP